MIRISLVLASVNNNNFTIWGNQLKKRMIGLIVILNRLR
ncbi:hypothetical protein H4683_003990 [Filibacter limicola]|uniref:Uncharacterized protein n=1 Tax=Sporosarcina limicola TaxID=34101 RepID=A0A927MLE5_9BACL|nr:hypothetical protein [Sporosarcina limicola]